MPGTDVEGDIEGDVAFIFFSSINGSEVGSLHVLVILGIALSYNIPEDTLMEAAPWVNTNGENTGTGYAFSSMINGNNVYVAPAAEAKNVYKSLSEIPEELLNTQLTINNTQALTKLFIKYK